MFALFQSYWCNLGPEDAWSSALWRPLMAAHAVVVRIRGSSLRSSSMYSRLQNKWTGITDVSALAGQPNDGQVDKTMMYSDDGQENSFLFADVGMCSPWSAITSAFCGLCFKIVGFLAS